MWNDDTHITTSDDSEPGRELDVVGERTKCIVRRWAPPGVTKAAPRYPPPALSPERIKVKNINEIIRSSYIFQKDSDQDDAKTVTPPTGVVSHQINRPISHCEVCGVEWKRVPVVGEDTILGRILLNTTGEIPQHTVLMYVIQCYSGSETWITRHRYSSFYNLHHTLLNQNPSIFNKAKLPRRTLVRRTSHPHAAARVRMLNSYLKKVSSHCSPLLHTFLSPDSDTEIKRISSAGGRRASKFDILTSTQSKRRSILLARESLKFRDIIVAARLCGLKCEDSTEPSIPLLVADESRGRKTVEKTYRLGWANLRHEEQPLLKRSSVRVTVVPPMTTGHKSPPPGLVISRKLLELRNAGLSSTRFTQPGAEWWGAFPPTSSTLSTGYGKYTWDVIPLRSPVGISVLQNILHSIIKLCPLSVVLELRSLSVSDIQIPIPLCYRTRCRVAVFRGSPPFAHLSVVFKTFYYIQLPRCPNGGGVLYYRGKGSGIRFGKLCRSPRSEND